MIERFLDCPPNYAPDEFFMRYVVAFIPGVYRTAAESASEMAGRDFLRYWGWDFDLLMKETRTPYSEGQVSGYSFQRRSTILTGASSLIADIYKSSFLRTVDWFRRKEWITEEFAKDWALKVVPVDITSWEIQPSPLPQWWPTKKATTSALESFEEFARIETLIEYEAKEGQLFAVEGAVPTDAHQQLSSTEFSLSPFAYKVHGRKIPEARILATLIDRSLWQKAPTAPNPLAVFEGTMRGWVPFFGEDVDIGEFELRPLVSRIKFTNVSAWQPARIHHPPFFPGFSLVRDGLPVHDNESWAYSESGIRVFIAKDWQLGSLEWLDRGRYVQHGQYAYVDPAWLNERLRPGKWRIAYLLRMSVKQRKYEYEEPNEFTQYKTLKLSPLVL